MHTDVVDLRAFYASSMGQVARRMIRRQIRLCWPDARGLVVAGLGYAVPFLRPFRDEANRVLAFMTATQGAVFWPWEGPGAVALADEAELPLPDLSVDRILVVHGLETTEKQRAMMREIWRVLSGDGRLLVVVPNRRGLWARADWTPFGHGYPYAAWQLRRVLSDSLFVPQRTEHALFIPPLRSRFSLAWAPAWEEIGQRWFKAFSGVTLVEAVKQVYAGSPLRSGVSLRRRILPVPQDPLPARARLPERRRHTL